MHTSTTGFIMNTADTNVGGWNGSDAYKTIMSQFKAILPSDLQTVIRTTRLYTDNTGNKSTAASAVTSNENQVYYLAEYEVLGSNNKANPNEPAQQAQYDYYKSGNSRIKYRSDSTTVAASWWLRSPFPGDSGTFCTVTNNVFLNYDANTSRAVAPCFKV